MYSDMKAYGHIYWEVMYRDVVALFPGSSGCGEARDVVVYRDLYRIFSQSFMEEILQDTVELKTSFLPWGEAVERLCITSCSAHHLVLPCLSLA